MKLKSNLLRYRSCPEKRLDPFPVILNKSARSFDEKPARETRIALQKTIHGMPLPVATRQLPFSFTKYCCTTSLPSPSIGFAMCPYITVSTAARLPRREPRQFRSSRAGRGASVARQ